MIFEIPPIFSCFLLVLVAGNKKHGGISYETNKKNQNTFAGCFDAAVRAANDLSTGLNVHSLRHTASSPVQRQRHDLRVALS